MTLTPHTCITKYSILFWFRNPVQIGSSSATRVSVQSPLRRGAS